MENPALDYWTGWAI